MNEMNVETLSKCSLFVSSLFRNARFIIFDTTIHSISKVIPIKFGSHVASGRNLIAKAGAYMSELGDVDVGCSLDCSPTTCCCAGLGCCRQKLSGSDGSIAFLNAGGTLVYKNLKAGETITIDSGSVVGFEDSARLGCTPNGRFCTCCCGGEGCFSTTLTGPGRVYMQS